jgi:hypothetical protein
MISFGVGVANLVPGEVAVGVAVTLEVVVDTAAVVTVDRAVGGFLQNIAEKRHEEVSPMGWWWLVQPARSAPRAMCWGGGCIRLLCARTEATDRFGVLVTILCKEKKNTGIFVEEVYP